MLEKLYDSLSFYKDKDLSDLVVVGCQHLMESTLELFKALAVKGLKMDSIFLLGKCYSSSQAIIEEMQSIGIYVSPYSCAFDSYRSFDDQYRQYVSDFLVEVEPRILSLKEKKILILDDGGFLIREVRKFPKILTLVSSGIEQTSSGAHLLTNFQHNIPIINVARSEAKLVLETPVIVDSFFERLDYICKSENLKYSGALVLGMGALGMAILEVFNSRGIQAYSYDPKGIGAELPLEILEYKACNLVIGASGKLSLKASSLLKLEKHLILASISSSDREFEGVDIRQRLQQTKDCGVHVKWSNLTLLSSGFPINFFRERNNISLEKIQITLALLAGAIFQAASLNNFRTGLVELDRAFQDFIIFRSKENVRLQAKHYNTLTA